MVIFHSYVSLPQCISLLNSLNHLPVKSSFAGESPIACCLRLRILRGYKKSTPFSACEGWFINPDYMDISTLSSEILVI